MIVQHNMQAMNANRMLGITNGCLSKSTEKLSSGYRVNRAADDAAGLTISEKMRKQIRGLDQASTNAEDGISCVQTAEGALTEVHSMLQRMNELAVQASNGTMSTEDRQAIQDEIDQLVTESDRVSETTKFNETYLLKGDGTKDATKTVGQTSMTAVYATAPTESVSFATGTTGTDATGYYAAGSTTELTYDDLKDLLEVKDGKLSLKEGTALYNQPADAAGEWGDQLQGTIVELSDFADKFKVTSTALYDQTSQTEIKEEDLKKYFNEDGTYQGGLAAYAADGTLTEVGADRIGNFATVTAANGGTEETYQVPAALEFNLHVGAESAEANKISVEIEAMSAQGIGIDVLSGNGLMTEDTATKAIDTIGDAIEKVSKQRSDLGAVQNRLEHTIANLDNVVENTTAAESRIRDLDMAEEMVAYSKNNILLQAGQSMLAQANQATQGVLSLLQ